MNNNSKFKKNLLIVGGAILFFLIVFGLIFLTSKKPSQPQPTITPSTSLLLREIHPRSGSIAFGNSQNSISIFFDKEIDLTTVIIESTPKINFQIKTLPDFPQRIILSPQSNWQVGITYKITIKKGIKAKEGNLMTQSDISLQYTILPEETPFPEEEYPSTGI